MPTRKQSGAKKRTRRPRRSPAHAYPAPFEGVVDPHRTPGMWMTGPERVTCSATSPPTSPLDLELVELFKQVKAIRDRRRAERRTSTPAPKTSVLRPGWNLAQDPEVVALFREAVRLRFLREAEDREEENATGSPPADVERTAIKKGGA